MRRTHIVFFFAKKKMATQNNTHLNINLNLDLFCVETSMEEEETMVQQEMMVFPLHEGREEEMLMFCDDDELLLLSSKEKETSLEGRSSSPVYTKTDPFLFSARMEGVNRLMMASTHLGFTAQTTILAVDYFDRFMSSEGKRVGDSQPWLTQLCSVACLSLAAKVEETQVPLLLDLQVEETRFVFEAKTIQRMELLVLSALGWKMNPVTPLSFVDHIVRRMASETDKNRQPKRSEFQNRCHSVLLSVLADSRWLDYLPSVMASATMMYVIRQMDLGNQILSLLTPTKEEVDECYHFILDSMANGDDLCGIIASNKRKYPQYSYRHYPPSSPTEILGSVFSYESSNDSWSSVVSSSSLSSSQHHPMFKRLNSGTIRSGEEQQCKHSIQSVFVMP